MKAAHCKVVLDTEYAAQPLTEVFGDFLYAYQQSGKWGMVRIVCACGVRYKVLYVSFSLRRLYKHTASFPFCFT